jgi:hypothetical protein
MEARHRFEQMDEREKETLARVAMSGVVRSSIF